MCADLLIHPDGGSKGVSPGTRLLPLLNQADSGPKLAMARLIAMQLSCRHQPALIAAVGKQPDDPVIERWGPVALIVLAAGGSSRMGRPKQLMHVDGESMIVRAVKIALQSHASEILVVTGAYAEEVKHELASLYTAASERVRLVQNPDWRSGQASSMHAAIQALSSSTEAAIFMPADQPFLRPQLLRLLQRRWQMGARFAAPSLRMKFGAHRRSLTDQPGRSCWICGETRADVRCCVDMLRRWRRFRQEPQRSTTSTNQGTILNRSSVRKRLQSFCSRQMTEVVISCEPAPSLQSGQKADRRRGDQGWPRDGIARRRPVGRSSACLRRCRR
jgi:CTP:molybdopterin cytidylyltransferase MocA